MPTFDGVTFDPERDESRLLAQLTRVRGVLWDEQEHTLAEIESLTGDPQASISARIRDLRKAKFGGYSVRSRCIHQGLWGYRLIRARPGTWGHSRTLLRLWRERRRNIINLRERRRRAGR